MHYIGPQLIEGLVYLLWLSVELVQDDVVFEEQLPASGCELQRE